MAELTPQNDPASTLASGISAGAGSLTVASGDGTGKGFSDPAGTNVGRLVLVRASDGKKEIISFSDRAGDVFTLSMRAAEPVRGDQTAYAFVTGDAVYEILTNASLAALLAAVTPAHSALTGVTANQHHNQSHSISGADHSGTLAHSALGSLSADDHTQYARKDTLTTKGDLYAATAASAPARVAVGTDGQFLKADSGAASGVSYANPPTGGGVRAYNAGDQNVVTATETALTFDSERHDDLGEHSTSSNTGRLTAVGSGMRGISGSATFDTPILAGTVRRLSIRLNGTTVIARQEDYGVLNSGQTTVAVSCDYYLSTGDYVELMAYQDSGGTIAVKALGNYSPEFGMTMGGSSTLPDHDHTAAAGDGGTLTGDTHDGYSDFAEIATPATPAANHGRLYGKDVGGVTKPHWKDDGGTETQLGAGGGGSLTAAQSAACALFIATVCI